MSLQVRPSPSTYLTFQDWNSFQWISEFSFNTDIYSINQNYNPTALQCVILKIIFVPCWESPATYVSPLSYSDFSFTFTCLYLQDFNSSAIYWPLGGVLSLTLKYLVYLVCARSSRQVVIQRQVLWFLHRRRRLRPSCIRPRYTNMGNITINSLKYTHTHTQRANSELLQLVWRCRTLSSSFFLLL